MFDFGLAVCFLKIYLLDVTMKLYFSEYMIFLLEKRKLKSCSIQTLLSQK